MDRIAAVALLDLSATPLPDRRERDSAATDRRIDLLTVGAIAASARAQAIAVAFAALMVGGVGGTIGEETQVAAVPYRIIDGKVDGSTYNGYRRYHAGCNHCHGPDGLGSSFGPSLVDAPLDADAFREVVRKGRVNGTSVMKGYAGDANVEPYVDDIYAYLRARADGALDRGRPARSQ
jgi:mono/diheme cytochrome c family protein